MGLFTKKESTTLPAAPDFKIPNTNPVAIQKVDQDRLDKVVELAKFNGIKHFVLLWQPEDGINISCIHDIQFNTMMQLFSVGIEEGIKMRVEMPGIEPEAKANLNLFLKEFKEVTQRSNARFKSLNERLKRSADRKEKEDGESES